MYEMCFVGGWITEGTKKEKEKGIKNKNVLQKIEQTHFLISHNAQFAIYSGRSRIIHVALCNLFYLYE